MEKTKTPLFAILAIVLILILVVVIIVQGINNKILVTENSKLSIKNSELIATKIELQKALDTETDKQTNIDNCLADAYEVYLADWNKACKNNSLGDDCQLPLLLSESIENGYRQLQTNCTARY